MSLCSIKAQEIRAGGFTVRIGSHGDTAGGCYLQITGATEGHHISFGPDGSVLTISPIMPVDAPAEAQAEGQAPDPVDADFVEGEPDPAARTPLPPDMEPATV